MGQESVGKDGSRSPEKHEDVKESQSARISRKLTESQQFMGRVKDKLPGIEAAKSIKGDIKSIINESRGRRLSMPQRLSDTSSSSRRSSLSGRGKELLKKHVSIHRAKQDVKPKQKDPLHQWMVEHSGGSLREKG
ncbi:uncharacterized protein GGS22DRAFT_192573 [Annulohypoxylon maeteangense]|uniref:uncharacterized protein n=1 Tax=Annulohypoxylon maeteangense TaxID=1927788 RepID=UPI0020082132|nr:uncharacterized protein GGS22DRAFT_192573 [Annulohypoxylon maeteangense]KAI0881086.1 hypothetical protein GGS22DRAFT_192573 [Annulohypoxylon maeteangense]